MRGTYRRSFVGAAASPAALVLTTAVAIAGCAASPAPATKPATPQGAAALVAAQTTRPPPPREREAIADRNAQRTWCSYLQALYLRADQNATAWPKFAECVQVKSTAAPALLTQTAECSRRALDAFVGDPFTLAYAGEVSRCGSAALELLSASSVEIEPFVDDLCGRAVACGQLDAAQCRASLHGNHEVSLERAVGALNRTGREELRACLRASSCDDLKGSVPRCLEPIMDRLLWLPE